MWSSCPGFMPPREQDFRCRGGLGCDACLRSIKTSRPAACNRLRRHIVQASGRHSNASRSCSRAVARSAPTRPASTRRWSRPNLHPDWVAGNLDRRHQLGHHRRQPAREGVSTCCADFGEASPRCRQAIGRMLGIQPRPWRGGAFHPQPDQRLLDTHRRCPRFFRTAHAGAGAASGRQPGGDQLLRNEAAPGDARAFRGLRPHQRRRYPDQPRRRQCAHG